MTADKPSPFVPKLRFPEFLSRSTWDELTIGDVCDLKAGDFIPASEIAEHADEGSFPCYGGNGFRGYVKSFTHEGRYVLVGRQGALCGNVNLYAGKFHATEHALVATPKPGIDTGWLFYALDVLTLNRFSTGQAQPGLSAGVLRDVGISVPIGEDEQQKIADCLGSLDDLIAAEGRKLHALQMHNQGLVQQLFPRPGETVPRLRFPEFRVDTTWLAPRLADLYGFKRTNTLSRDNLNYQFGMIRNIHYGDIHTKFKPLFRLENEHVPYVNLDVAPDGFDDDAFCEEGDIVLADASEDLDGVGTALEVVSLNGERVVAGTHTILATRRGSVPVVGFGGQLFQSAAVRTGIKREAQGAKVYGISANRISAIPVPVPPTEAEQQRIATCLSALEDLLAAQARKIDALKQQKQGLLQQLFSSLETE